MAWRWRLVVRTGFISDVSSVVAKQFRSVHRLLTVSQVGPAPMFSRSCAGHTISTSGHQWSFWPGDRWRHVFGPRLHFYALSAIRSRRPSCYNVRAFPECSNDWLPLARWNTRNARFANVLTCLLFRCSLVVHACPLDGHVGHRLPISLPFH